jgi:hypothetical protein
VAGYAVSEALEVKQSCAGRSGCTKQKACSSSRPFFFARRCGETLSQRLDELDHVVDPSLFVFLHPGQRVQVAVETVYVL